MHDTGQEDQSADVDGPGHGEVIDVDAARLKEVRREERGKGDGMGDYVGEDGAQARCGAVVAKRVLVLRFWVRVRNTIRVVLLVMMALLLGIAGSISSPIGQLEGIFHFGVRVPGVEPVAESLQRSFEESGDAVPFQDGGLDEVGED